MTPTEQDKTSDKELKRIIDFVINHTLLGTNATLDWRKRDELVKQATELITADRKRVALEARISELNKIALDNYRGKTVSSSTNWQAKFEYFMDSNERRIAGLKAQQEEMLSHEFDGESI